MMKSVSPLTEAQRKQLREMMDKDSSTRARKRAHSILLSESLYSPTP